MSIKLWKTSTQRLELVGLTIWERETKEVIGSHSSIKRKTAELKKHGFNFILVPCIFGNPHQTGFNLQYRKKKVVSLSVMIQLSTEADGLVSHFLAIFFEILRRKIYRKCDF